MYSTDAAASPTAAATDAVNFVTSCCGANHTAYALTLALTNACRHLFAQDSTAANCILLYVCGIACRTIFGCWTREEYYNRAGKSRLSRTSRLRKHRCQIKSHQIRSTEIKINSNLIYSVESGLPECYWAAAGPHLL